MISKYLATFFTILVLGGLVILGVLQYGLQFTNLENPVLMYIYGCLLFFPVLALLIGLLIVIGSRDKLHYFPEDGDAAFVWLSQSHRVLQPPTQPALAITPAVVPTAPARVVAPTPPAVQQADWMQASVGLLQAVLFDLSGGVIRNPGLYHGDAQQALTATLVELQPYRDRGWSFHFELYTHEPYQVVLRNQISPTDYVAEIDGLCNYYFERAGEAHPTPHSYDVAPPLMRTPVMFRLRVVAHPQTGRWQVAGFSESVTGSMLGWPVA